MAKKAGKSIMLRILCAVLLDGIRYPANTALSVDEAQAKSLVADGLADDNEAAVAYALTQGKLVTHQPEAVDGVAESTADAALTVDTDAVLS